jgi:hypothetical protein
MMDEGFSEGRIAGDREWDPAGETWKLGMVECPGASGCGVEAVGTEGAREFLVSEFHA